MALCDDLYLNAGASQSIYYATTSTAPNRQLVFEFLTGHFSFAHVEGGRIVLPSLLTHVYRVTNVFFSITYLFIAN